MKKGKIIEVLAKVIVAALTAFLTAITTTSCIYLAVWAITCLCGRCC